MKPRIPRKRPLFLGDLDETQKQAKPPGKCTIYNFSHTACYVKREILIGLSVRFSLLPLLSTAGASASWVIASC